MPETALCRNRCGRSVEVVTLFEFRLVPWCQVCVEADMAGERERRVERLMSQANAPAKFRRWSLATYPRGHAEGQAAFEAANGWLLSFLSGERHNLLLYGDVGVGKTGLAWSLVRAACEEGIDAMFVNLRDYLWGVRKTFDSGAEQDTRPHVTTLLALDDLGAERPTDFAREELATLIDQRAGAGRATIVTSNYAPDELARRLGHDELVIGQRLVSRLVQDATQVRIEGKDRRLPI